MPHKQKGFAPVVVLIFLAIVGFATYGVSKVAPNIHISYGSPKPSESPVASSSPEASPSPSVFPKPSVKPTPSCTVIKTYGMFDNNPELESEKCYTSADANALNDAIRKYNNAIFNYNGAASQANVTCGGFTESFKQQCEISKQNVAKYQAEIDLYKSQIKIIMGRGK